MNRDTRQANEKKKNKSSPRYQIDTFEEWDACRRAAPVVFRSKQPVARRCHACPGNTRASCVRPVPLSGYAISGCDLGR